MVEVPGPQTGWQGAGHHPGGNHNPGASARWWRLALYRLTGRLDEAVADCDTAIEQRPEDADFISVQAEIFYAMGRHEAARAGFAKAIKN